jgi:UDP-N-acetylglucosamine 2-epimerase
MKQRILVVFGTRPEAVKLAPVIAELRRHPAQFEVIVCLTGQHRQMVDDVVSLFRIRIDHDLSVMTANQNLAGLTSRLFSELDVLTGKVHPDWTVVQGDTTTAMVAATTAFYRGVRIGHVEAGLRTLDLRQPFPEEFNRRVADIVADAYFASTAGARENLLREGVSDERIAVTGNTGIDALLEVAERSYDWTAGPLRLLDEARRLVVVTAHRRESFGEPFRKLCLGIRDLSTRFPDTDFVYPVHLNPNVQSVAREIMCGLGNLHLLPPVDYLTMVKLLQRAFLVITDSGGIQEEAPSFGCPILVARETTERPEAVSAGFATLVGTDPDRITSAGAAMLSRGRVETRIHAANPFGDGHASQRIAAHLARAVRP